MPLASNDAAPSQMHPASFRSQSEDTQAIVLAKKPSVFPVRRSMQMHWKRRVLERTAMSFDPDKPFHDGYAPTIDKAIASSVIAHYVGGNCRRLRGTFKRRNRTSTPPGITNGAAQGCPLKTCQALPTETIDRSRSN
jgi:hypothetical protein